jgi:hypothetical protein
MDADWNATASSTGQGQDCRIASLSMNRAKGVQNKGPVMMSLGTNQVGRLEMGLNLVHDGTTTATWLHHRASKHEHRADHGPCHAIPRRKRIDGRKCSVAWSFATMNSSTSTKAQTKVRILNQLPPAACPRLPPRKSVSPFHHFVSCFVNALSAALVESKPGLHYPARAALTLTELTNYKFTGDIGFDNIVVS